MVEGVLWDRSDFTHASIKVWRVRDGVLLHAVDQFVRLLDPLAVSTTSDGAQTTMTIIGALNSRYGLGPANMKVWRHIARDDGSSTQCRQLGRQSGCVKCVAVSADGSTAIGGSDEMSVKVWRVKDGILLHTYHHADQVLNVTLSAHGSTMTVASVSRDRCVKVYEHVSGTLRQMWFEADRSSSEDRPPDQMALSADGSMIVSQGERRMRVQMDPPRLRRLHTAFWWMELLRRKRHGFGDGAVARLILEFIESPGVVATVWRRSEAINRLGQQT